MRVPIVNWMFWCMLFGWYKKSFFLSDAWGHGNLKHHYLGKTSKLAYYRLQGYVI
jgi:hypothetical protein